MPTYRLSVYGVTLCPAIRGTEEGSKTQSDLAKRFMLTEGCLAGNNRV
jgi:hypothetical protein